MMSNTIEFLSVELVRSLHIGQIQQYGGLYGIRDEGLLNSAVHAPQATFDSRFLCEDIFEMASIYAYSLINNHPFIDGNKRIGMVAAFFFLEINGIEMNVSEEDFYALGIAIASSTISQKNVADFLRSKSI